MWSLNLASRTKHPHKTQHNNIQGHCDRKNYTDHKYPSD